MVYIHKVFPTNAFEPQDVDVISNWELQQRKARENKLHQLSSKLSKDNLLYLDTISTLLTGFAYIWESFLLRTLVVTDNSKGSSVPDNSQFPSNSDPLIVDRYKNLYAKSNLVLSCYSNLLTLIVGSSIRLCPDKLAYWVDKTCGEPLASRELTTYITSSQFDCFICADDWSNWTTFVVWFVACQRGTPVTELTCGGTKAMCKSFGDCDPNTTITSCSLSLWNLYEWSLDHPEKPHETKVMLVHWYRPVWTLIAQIFLSLGLTSQALRTSSPAPSSLPAATTGETDNDDDQFGLHELLMHIKVLICATLLLLPCSACAHHVLVKRHDVRLYQLAKQAFINGDTFDVWCRIYYEFHRTVNVSLHVLDVNHGARHKANFCTLHPFEVNKSTPSQQSGFEAPLEPCLQLDTNAVDVTPEADFTLKQYCLEVLRNLLHRKLNLITRYNYESSANNDGDWQGEIRSGECPHLALVHQMHAEVSRISSTR